MSPELKGASSTANAASPDLLLPPNESVLTTTHNPLDLQAHKLQRLFSFVHATARTVASLAFGGAAR